MANQGQVTNYFAMSTDTTPLTEEQNHTFATIGVTGGSSESTYYCTADVSFNFLSPEEGTDLKENIKAGDLKAKFKTTDNNATVSGLSSKIDLYNYTDGYKKTINITLTGAGASTAIKGDIYLVNKEEEQNYMANAKLEANITVTNLKCSTIEPEVKAEPKLCSTIDLTKVDDSYFDKAYTDGIYTYIYGEDMYDEPLKNPESWSVAFDQYGTYTGAYVYEGESLTEPPCTMIDDEPIVSASVMFAEVQLTTIDLSNWDTSYITDMDSMFFMIDVDEIKLPENFGFAATDMNIMFSDSQIGKINLNNINTSSTTNMNGLFNNTQITTIDISNWNTSRVINMNHMFLGAVSDEIILPKDFGSAATDMGGMFYGSQIKDINLNNMITSNATDMSDMFSVAQIPTLDLTSFVINDGTEIEGMFNRCTATTVYVKQDMYDKFKEIAKSSGFSEDYIKVK